MIKKLQEKRKNHISRPDIVYDCSTKTLVGKLICFNTKQKDADALTVFYSSQQVFSKSKRINTVDRSYDFDQLIELRKMAFLSGDLVPDPEKKASYL